MNQVTIGSMYKERGSWVWKFQLNGKQVKRRLGKAAVMNKHQAEEAQRELIRQLSGSFHGLIRETTFRDLASKWLETQSLDRKPKTIQTIEYRLGHLMGFFGDTVVNAIAPDDIERFKVSLKSRGSVNATTINDILTTLNRVMDAGVRWGFLYSNPCKHVEKLKAKRRSFEVLSAQEALQLLDVSTGQDRLILQMAIETGMREGELIGARWKDLDWNEGTYEVRENFSARKRGTPKTESSIRVIPVSGSLLTALRHHKALQNEYRLKCGSFYQDQGLIFPSQSGTPLNPSNLRNRVLRPAIVAAGITKHIRFHDLRGTFTSLLLEAGGDLKAIQDLLGHKTPSLTLRVYAKSNQATRKTAISKLETLLSKNGMAK